MRKILIISMILVLFLVGCSKQLITPEELQKLKADQAALETKNADLQKELDSYKTDASMYKSKAMLWDHTLSAYKATPVKPAMPHHVWADLGDGSYAFLETDADGDELVSYGIALPGQFCMEDAAQLPPSFSYFQLGQCEETDAQKCAPQPADEGYWMMHIMLEEGAKKPMSAAPPQCMVEEAEEP